MIFSPLPGKPLITQGFGQNPDVYGQFGYKGHNGLDFGIPEGTPIYAPHDGTITVKNEGSQGYGLSVVIDDGKRRSLLAHLSVATVSNGQWISQGDPIGKSGMTGMCTGPHLHWTFKLLKSGVVQNKNNGYDGAMDPSEVTRLWQAETLKADSDYTDEAREYLTIAFGSDVLIKGKTV